MPVKCWPVCAAHGMEGRGRCWRGRQWQWHAVVREKKKALTSSSPPRLLSLIVLAHASARSSSVMLATPRLPTCARRHRASSVYTCSTKRLLLCGRLCGRLLVALVESVLAARRVGEYVSSDVSTVYSSASHQS